MDGYTVRYWYVDVRQRGGEELDPLRRVLVRLEGFDLSRLHLLERLNDLGQLIAGLRMAVLVGTVEEALAPQSEAMRMGAGDAYDQFARRLALARGELYAYARDELGIPTKRLASLAGVSRQRVEALIEASRTGELHPDDVDEEHGAVTA